MEDNQKKEKEHCGCRAYAGCNNVVECDNPKAKRRLIYGMAKDCWRGGVVFLYAIVLILAHFE